MLLKYTFWCMLENCLNVTNIHHIIKMIHPPKSQIAADRHHAQITKYRGFQDLVTILQGQTVQGQFHLTNATFDLLLEILFMMSRVSVLFFVVCKLQTE